MTHAPAPATSSPRSGLTLTQVLALGRQLDLYGTRIGDIAPRGDLGLGLDPEGPVGFALIRAYRHQGRFIALPTPLVLSVFGEGQPSDATDTDRRADERRWTMAAADRALRLEVQQGTLAALLGPAPAVEAAALQPLFR